MDNYDSEERARESEPSIKVDNERLEHFYDYALNVHKFNSNALLSKMKTSQKSIETLMS